MTHDDDRLQPFFTIYELASRWNIAASTIRKDIRAGALRATRFGTSCVRISLAEIERYIALRTSTQTVVQKKNRQPNRCDK